MKKYLFVLSMLALGLSSCIKNDVPPPFDPVAQAKIDDASIQTYLAAHSEIIARKDSSGLYYQVLAEGTGADITTASIVKVNYVGTTLQGAQFDARDDFSTALTPTTNLILGWKIGIPKVKVGGKILLILPSAFAYGPNGNGPIPPNSVLIFTITVKESSTSGPLI